MSLCTILMTYYFKTKCVVTCLSDFPRNNTCQHLGFSCFHQNQVNFLMSVREPRNRDNYSSKLLISTSFLVRLFIRTLINGPDGIIFLSEADCGDVNKQAGKRFFVTSRLNFHLGITESSKVKSILGAVVFSFSPKFNDHETGKNNFS